MTLSILRHPLSITDEQIIRIAAPGRALSVAVSRSNPLTEIDLWSMEYLDIPKRFQLLVQIIGTGHRIDEATLLGDFVGTVVLPNELVFHTFARRI